MIFQQIRDDLEVWELISTSASRYKFLLDNSRQTCMSRVKFREYLTIIIELKCLFWETTKTKQCLKAVSYLSILTNNFQASIEYKIKFATLINKTNP